MTDVTAFARGVTLTCAALIITALACRAPSDPAPAAACPTGAARFDEARGALLQALERAQALEPGRRVSHISHTCSLVLGDKHYPVIDLQELVPNEMTARGVNSILILAPDLTLLHRINYTVERPLFCVADRLYVWGDIWFDTLGTEGNELTFNEEGHPVSVRHLEANAVPAPLTKSPDVP